MRSASFRRTGFVEFSIEETEQSIPQRFEQQVFKHPYHIALKSETHQLTYAELNQYANQLARTIIARGSSDGTVVLLLQHDIAAVIGILGALKAGRPFVPLDPSLPRERFKYILQDSQADLIVMNGRSLATARQLIMDRLGLVNLDHLDSQLSAENLDLPITPAATSWILYTSGSTGQPKGVLQTHRNELHNIMNHTNSLALDSYDRFSLLGSYSTGQGMQDIYSALLNGGTLYPLNIKAEGPRHLAEWLIQEKITIYHSAATVFRHFVYSLSGKEKFPDLRIVRLGSEQVTWKDVDLYRRNFSDQCIFVNALSSSECRTFRQIFIKKEASFTGSVPVGYEVPDKKVLLLDDYGNEVGPGQVGEIAIRSRYLSPGYWRRPDLTSKAFTRDHGPSDEPVYRSGDLGRFRPDGALEHLGRKDFQVKIRGYRVEPHEIELALLEIPEVQEAVVVPRSDRNGEQRLIAYLAIGSQSKPTVSRLRKLLRRKLPEYMIPASFVILAALPLSPTGKLDVQSLPEPGPGRPELDIPVIQPFTPVEEQLVDIWIDILGVDRVGIHDSFFDLGGNSLLAALMISRTTEQFRIRIELGSFFSLPTVSSLAQKVAAILETGEEYIRPPIARAESNGNAPLSYAQERLWFLDQWEPGRTAYNICRGFRLTGPLNSGALEQSLSQLVARHETLRTRFATIDGYPIQIVVPYCNVTIEVVEVGGLTVVGREQEMQRLAREEARTTFVLASAPLLRAKLIRLSEEDHVFLLSVHQIIADGWSMQILLQELWTTYDAFTAGVRALLPDLQVQYADFALWQRAWLKSGGEIEKQLAYWKEQLRGPLPRIEIPSDLPRLSRQSFRGAKKPIEISQHVTRALKDLCRGEGISLFMILVAAFQAFLHRYTGQEDVVLGVPIANRNSPEVEEVVGLFVNTLVLRTDMSESPTFRELLSRVRDVCVGAYTHQDLPFERLVEELQPLRDPSRNPVFQLMFILQNVPERTVDVANLTVHPILTDTQSSKFDLTLALVEREQKLIGSFEYSTDLFNRDTIERMAGHFQILLESIVATPDQSISTLPLLTEAERRQLAMEWNDTAADYPDCCIHELFEAQAQRTPEAIALEFDGKRLTYNDLNRRANQVAHYLQNLGIGVEKLVGICVERSLEMIVGLLGILKAGGVYVPLDPNYPTERLQFMVEDSQASVILTQDSLAQSSQLLGISSLANGSSSKITCLDSDWDTIAQQSGENLNRLNSSTNLAYVIYTSGSTGQPKGVQIEHRSVVNCLHSIRRLVEVTKNDALLAVTTISFDIAGLELYLPLIVGARVVLASREETADGRLLLKRLKDSSATVMQATPSTWKLLLEAEWEGRSDLKILCGGEALSRQLADQLLARGTMVWNFYGPTETTIWSTAYQISPDESQVPIGRPISNTEIYILDVHQQLVPVGIPGEIQIGGVGVARGYLNRSKLSKEKFIPHPFSNEPEARLYRTGDLARYRADGNIEFFGRVDNQVKIRGHRIELGEIESVLNRHRAVKESVVVARARESSEEKELVGYVVPNPDLGFSVSDVRAVLRQKLPDYMIPSLFVFLNALPLTSNGKVDRLNLPPPDNSRPALDQGFVEPRSGIEELVAQVWREALKLDKIGAFDNFFDLGGHSLLATRVVARLRSNFNIDLLLRKLFELPTVAGLAAHVDFLRCNQSGVSVPPIRPVSRARAIPLSFSQRRLWFLHKVDSDLTAYNIPATFSIKGVLNAPVLERAVNEMVNRHEVLRIRVAESDGQPCQQIVESLTLALPVIDLSQSPPEQAEAEVHRLSAEDVRQPYRLAEAPLMRAKLLRLKEQEHVLILNFHHIVCDGSSLIIFYRELASIYEMLLNGRAPNLPSLPVQFADYAVWQQNELQGEVLEPQLAYWKRQLGTGLMTLNLPTDYYRADVQTYHGKRLTRTISDELTKALKKLSREEGVTLFMTLLASLDILLSRHTGKDDIVVGSTIAGRNRPEIDGLIGFFINALALRIDLGGNPSFVELVKRVREVCLDAYTHQDLPFEKIVEELNPQRDLSRNPLFQVLFNMADTTERTLTLPGCTVTKLSSSDPSAKFDIVIHAPEVDGRIELAMVYNADLFSERRITHLLDQFSHLLSRVADNPQRPIDEYSIATPSAIAVIPDPAEPLDDTWEGSIHKLFAGQAERGSDSLAVIDPDNRWTYGELERRGNQLANYLIAQGIQPGDVVAVYAHRSSALVVALLGILKAGAVFVILDPGYPASRLISYLRIARPHAWLNIEGAGKIVQELRAHLATLNLCCQLNVPNGKLSPDVDPLRAYSERDPGRSIQADDPAYVAFTSGSTGEPKGVLSRHGPITHFLPWQKDAFDMRQTDRFALLSGLAYSHLHRDIFTALSLGATLYIPDPQIARSPEPLIQWLRENDISILHLTPALGQLLLTAGDKTLPSVRRVLFGGDVLTGREVANIRQLATHAKIGSFYGATETQRAVAYYEVSEQLALNGDEAIRPVPLGRGMKDVQLLLLNANRQLAGIGELAELYVRSPHLAMGYIGDDELTRQNFLVNPFTDNPRDRLYRTGELGRYLPDGNVEWAGRNDRRVNIRGFRVELAEVEAVLMQHPAVREVAVIVREFDEPSAENPNSKIQNRKSDKRLAAYVVAEEKRESLVDLLRSFLGAKLPEYMVPTHFIFLEQLPLNPNGKVDYQTLPAVEQSLTGFTDPFAAPRSGLEAELCAVFSQVLGIERVGVNENFFRLGGHSLLAAQAAARIKEAFGVGLELRMFLELPTVAGLARQVESLLNTGKIITELNKDDREEIEI